MNLKVVEPELLPAMAIPFRLTPTRVLPITVAVGYIPAAEKDAHLRLGPPNWRGASKEQGI